MEHIRGYSVLCLQIMHIMHIHGEFANPDSNPLYWDSNQDSNPLKT